MNVCTDQLLLTLADPEQILGLSRFSRDGWQSWAADDARRYPMLSGGAEDVLVLKPDIVVASLFDKRSTRELSEGERAAPRRIRGAAHARRSEGPDPRDGRDRRASRSCGARDRPARRGDRARASAPWRTSIIACCRCRGAAGSRAATVLSARCWPRPGCSTRPAISASPSADLPRWKRSSSRSRIFFWCRRPAIAPRMTATPFCCIRRWSASIRRKSAS